MSSRISLLSAVSAILILSLVGCQNHPKFNPSDHKVATGGLINNPEEYVSTPHEITRVQTHNCYSENIRRNIAILFDGTDNKAESDTNISKIRNILIAQPAVNGCPRNYVLYVKGPGTGGNWFEQQLGKAFGTGTDDDVRQAYTFISKFYRGAQDRLYIIGFSRGASSARVLTSMLSIAGIPSPFPRDDSFIESVYKQYRSSGSHDDKQSELTQLFSKSGYSKIFAPVTFLGLFDTVNALGVRHVGEDKSQLSKDFSESMCNVQHASQAISIDDNRAKLFTPALLHKGLLSQCEPRKKSFGQFVEQVWFSGAHSDVGGGYLDTDLSAVSLNWMIDRLRYADKLADCNSQDDSVSNEYALIPNWAPVYQNSFGLSHDAEAHMNSATNLNRDWPHFLNPNHEKGVDAAVKAPVLHPDALKRIRLLPGMGRDFNWTSHGDGKKVTTNYPKCFVNKEPSDEVKSLLARFGYSRSYFKDYVFEPIESPQIEQGEACPTVWSVPKFSCNNAQLVDEDRMSVFASGEGLTDS